MVDNTLQKHYSCQMFTVCSKSQVSAKVFTVNATHLLTMLDPGDKVHRPSIIAPENHLHLSFADVEWDDQTHAPTKEDCKRILDFGKNLPDDAVTVVHCFAGMCRSTAAAIALYVQKHGPRSVFRAKKWLLEDRPQSIPNMLMARYFDDILNLNGELYRVCQEINMNHVMLIKTKYGNE